MELDGLRPWTILEVRQYRNIPLKEWIEANFESEILRGAAWSTVAFIKEKWPEDAKFLLGEMIHEDIVEE